MSFSPSLHRKTVNSQIVFAFFTLTILIVSLEILAHFWIRKMVAINSLKESSARLKELQLQVKSSSNEFILREKANERFFSSGKSIYLDRYAHFMSQLKKEAIEIRSTGGELGVLEESELTNLTIVLDAYNEVFLQMLDKIKTRGYGEYGLIGEFDKSINDLFQYDFGTDTKAILNLQLFVKDYLLTGDRDLINNISNEVFNFTMVLETHIRDEDVEKVSGILINYETVFKDLTIVDEELGIYTGGGLQGRLFTAIDNLDNAINLERTNIRIDEMSSSNLSKLYLSFFLVVGVSIIAAVVINRRLYKSLVIPIQQMKSVIARMSRGEVPQANIKFKVDDLNEMAIALNNLLSGIRNYQDFAINIGNGKLDVAFTPLSEQDLLGSSLLVMRENLKANAEEDKRRTWAAQGLAELGALLRNHSSTDNELHRVVLQFVVKYVGSNQGGLFLVKSEAGNEDITYLELVACYAWGKRKYVEKRVDLGVGMIGQCALEKEAIYVTNLPKEFIKITSGLGGSTPSALLIVPLKIEGNALGVLELASFNVFEKHQIELVKKFCEAIAAVVNTENVNSKTKRLLLQAQQQTEQLRAGQAELKNNMDALTAAISAPRVN